MKSSYRFLRFLAKIYLYAGGIGFVMALVLLIAAFATPSYPNLFASIVQSVGLAFGSLVLIGLHDAIQIGIELVTNARIEKETLARMEIKINQLVAAAPKQEPHSN